MSKVALWRLIGLLGLLVAVGLGFWWWWGQVRSSKSLIFRELDDVEWASAGSKPFSMDGPHDDAWIRQLLLKARFSGWETGQLARKIAAFDSGEIDGPLAKVIAGNQAALMPEAFKVLTICGGRLQRSTEAFRQVIESRLAGAFPMDKSYTGAFLSGVFAAASRLAMDGDAGMRSFITDARRSESFTGIEKAPVANDIMFEVICGLAPYCPDEETVEYLKSIEGRYPYAQRRISLIRAYQASGDDFQTYILVLAEGNPGGKNKYIEEYVPTNSGPPVPKVRGKIR